MLNIKMRRTKVAIQNVHIGCDGGNLSEVGGGVGEDDEVDDQEGGVEDQVGGADQDRAGADTELNTGHHSAHHKLRKSQH